MILSCIGGMLCTSFKTVYVFTKRLIELYILFIHVCIYITPKISQIYLFILLIAHINGRY